MLHISEVIRCAQKENTKWGKGKEKNRLVGEDVMAGDELVMLCLSLIC